MKLTIQLSKKWPANSAIMLPIFEGERFSKQIVFKYFPLAQRAFILQCLTGFKAKEGESMWLTIPHNGKVLKVLGIGLGKRQEFNMRSFRLRIRQITRLSQAAGVKEISVQLSSFGLEHQSAECIAQQMAENVILASYSFSAYRSSSKGSPKLSQIHVLVHTSSEAHPAQIGLRVGKTIGEYTNQVRSLANTPGGEMTPKRLAAEAKQLALSSGATFEVFGEAKMKQLGMGGILGVSRGSTEEAQFITLTHLGGKKGDAPIVLVGKGITFDSGGLNLKPSKGMDGMHLDMSGAASVIGVVCLAAKLKLPLNVLALAPAAENMPSGSGYRPGDVLKSFSGTTIEVGNTDAEGRIILADALGYAQQLKPKLVVDVATLTGAALVALGYRATAMFTDDDSLAHAFEHLAEESGDYIWRLPLWKEYASEVKGTFGDVMNLGKFPGIGGAITAAHFLKVFAGSMPWVHLDTAPTMETIDDQCLSKGASGSTVRLLIHLLRTSAKPYGKSKKSHS